MRSLRKNLIVFCLVIITLFLPAQAAYASTTNVYGDETYSIYDAVAYATEWAYSFNTNQYVTESQDCTNFVSQCLVAGGKATESSWYPGNDKVRQLLHGAAFIHAGDLKNYLSGKGHSIQIIHNGNCAAVYNANPSVGDVLIFDWTSDDNLDHSMIITGITQSGEILLSGHTTATHMRPLSKLQSCGSLTTIYVVHMTNNYGFKDVTKNYIGKKIKIRSLESNGYVTTNTDKDEKGINCTANISTAADWEIFEVVEGEKFYNSNSEVSKNEIVGAVGFRSVANGNFLSARVDENNKSPYIQAAFGHDYSKPQSWESFRIFEKDGIQYIQSQANGRWVQVYMDEENYPVKAAGASASTWERFKIECIDTNSSTGGNTNPVTPEPQPQRVYVSQYYHDTDYNEGYYEGEMLNGKPDGYGKLTYTDFEDGKYYSTNEPYGVDTKALYYEGYFSAGKRYGQGTVVYENGMRDVGTYSGAWSAGKVVFDGKRYDGDKGYWTLVMTAESTVSAKSSFGPWVSLVPEYTIKYDANGGTGAPAGQTKRKGESVTIRSEKPSRNGYEFLGWSRNQSAATPEYVSGSSYSNDSDTVLYAVWKIQSGSSQTVSYGEWSSWSESRPSDKEGREIESREVVVGYDLAVYLTQNASTYYREYRSFSIKGRYSDYGARSSYGEFYYSSYADKATLESADQYHNGDYVAYGSGTNGYIRCNDTAYIGGGLQGTTPWFITNTVKKTEYRYRDKIVVIIPEVPLITIKKQPTTVTVFEGEKAAFSVTATGSGLKYQWQYRMAGTTVWKDWSGKTTSSISVPYDANKNGMGIRCVITDSTGAKLTSNAVKLTYKEKLAITSQPANVKINTGTTASFKVTATGSGLKYQWQFMLAGKTTWTNWTGKTSATLSVPYDKKKNNMKVRCQVTDGSGNKLTSKEAVLVYTNLFEITTQPVNVTVESGHAAPFSVAVAGNGLTYQWQFKLASASGWKNWEGKTASLLKVPYDIKKNGMLVRCVITNDKGAKLTSGEAKLVYNGAAPAINRQPASISVASGHAGVFSIGVSGDTLSFQWQYKLAGTTAWKNWSGKTESTLKVAYDAKKDGMSVRCVVTDKNGKKVTSSAAIMTYTR